MAPVAKMHARSDDPGIRLLDMAEHRRWRALLARIEGRPEDEARYEAEAAEYDEQALAILEQEFAGNGSPGNDSESQTRNGEQHQ